MARTQTKQDKECFFADLERLCDTDSETESESEQYHNRSWLKPTRCSDTGKSYIQSPCVKPKNHTLQNYKRKHPSSPSSDRHAHTASLHKIASRTVIDLITPPGPPLPVQLASKHGPPTTTTKSGIKRSCPEKSEAPVPKRARKSKNEIQLVPEGNRIFSGLVFYFVPNDEIVKHRRLRVQRAKEYGGSWAEDFDETVTHVVVEPDINYIEAAKAFPGRNIPEGIIIVKNTWFSESLSSMYLRDVSQSRFRLLGAPHSSNAIRSPKLASPILHRLRKSPPQPDSPLRMLDLISSGVNAELERIIAHVKDAGPLPLSFELDNDTSFDSTVPETSFESSASDIRENSEAVPKENSGFQCMGSNNGKEDNNPNIKTIALLQEMATHYDQTGDQWRTTAYRKAIAALRKQTTLIATREQAAAIPLIGSRLADKIEEIVTTSHLRRLDNTKSEQHAKVLKLFMGIYGVGQKQASQWIAQGYRTLNDLLQRANPSQNQRIGIAHYDDFLQRIPRNEVYKHALIVRQACRAVDGEMRVIVGGSYRRGNADSGDIDLVITKRDADMSHIRTLLNSHVIPALTKAGFLKCALASSYATTGAGSKWHGASCLPNSIIWRRIDLLFVPWDEIGAALLYFTGNDIFNRSMRLLAAKKGMRLNQHGLYKDVMRGRDRVKMTEGTLLEGRNERKIFEILGVPWREPWERKC